MSDQGLEPLSERIKKLIKGIPFGKVATCGQIADMAGNRNASRLVVWVLHSSSDKDELPWHRVINSEGKISLKEGHGYEIQRAILVNEGVTFDEQDRVSLKKWQWRPVDVT